MFQVNRPTGSPVQNGQKHSGRGLLETHRPQRPLAPQSTQQPGDHSPWEEEEEGRLGAGEPSGLGGDTTRFPLHFPSSSHFSNTSPHLTGARSFQMPIGSLQYYKVNLTALHIWELRQRSGIWKTCPASYILLRTKTRPHP